MRRYYWCREDSRQRSKKTICEKFIVFHWYLWIAQFVWARAFCGTRIWCPATVDCSGTIRKIHVRKIRRGQGVARACYHDGFRDLGPFDEALETLQSPGVRADAQCCKITWLDELVSESNTIQAQEDITQAGLKQAKTRENYVWESDGFSLISLDCCVRLSSRLLWYKNKLSFGWALASGSRAPPPGLATLRVSL